MTQSIMSGKKGQLSSDYPVLMETQFLKPVATAIVPARTKTFNAAAFYQNRRVLFTYDEPAEQYQHNELTYQLDLNARQAMDSAPERPYVALLIKRHVFSNVIRKELLPETHLSPLEDIAGFIEAQPGGQSGFLLNDGSTNIFYVEGKDDIILFMFVCWHSVRGRWFVRGKWFMISGDDELLWPNNRILCPGTAVISN